jgi:hypothetical protein
MHQNALAVIQKTNNALYVKKSKLVLNSVLVDVVSVIHAKKELVNVRHVTKHLIGQSLRLVRILFVEYVVMKEHVLDVKNRCRVLHLHPTCTLRVSHVPNDLGNVKLVSTLYQGQNFGDTGIQIVWIVHVVRLVHVIIARLCANLTNSDTKTIKHAKNVLPMDE